jgi:hypothetical protein
MHARYNGARETSRLADKGQGIFRIGFAVPVRMRARSCFCFGIRVNEKRIYAAGLTRPINRLTRVRMANDIVSWFQWLTHQYPP